MWDEWRDHFHHTDVTLKSAGTVTIRTLKTLKTLKRVLCVVSGNLDFFNKQTNDTCFCFYVSFFFFKFNSVINYSQC